jgi:hypothetical protein
VSLFETLVERGLTLAWRHPLDFISGPTIAMQEFIVI